MINSIGINKSNFNSENDKKLRFPFLLVVLYLVFEYGRPQTFFPPLGVLRPAMIIQLMMLYYIALTLISLKFQRSQTTAIFLILIIMIPHVPLSRNTYWAFNTLKIMFLYLIVHLTIITYIKEFSKIVRITNIWLVIILIDGIIGIIHGGKIPGSSIMGDENDFSIVMNMALPVSFFLAVETKIKKENFFTMVLLAFSL